jgi:hypothetical protein
MVVALMLAPEQVLYANAHQCVLSFGVCFRKERRSQTGVPLNV